MVALQNTPKIILFLVRILLYAGFMKLFLALCPENIAPHWVQPAADWSCLCDHVAHKADARNMQNNKSKKKKKKKSRSREKGEQTTTGEKPIRRGHSTRWEVYLAPEDDNRLQINCNYVDIVQPARWSQDGAGAWKGGGAVNGLNLYRQSATVNK